MSKKLAVMFGANSAPLAAIALFIAAGTSAAAVPGGSLDPLTVPQFVEPLVIPPVMPAQGATFDRSIRRLVPYYEIEAVQFNQQILPSSLPTTPVWGYGAVGRPETRSYPGWTIESRKDFPTRVKWVNGLKDADGMFLKHLLPIDQTLHWTNPPKECIEHGMMMPGVTRTGTDCRGQSQDPYAGPVPIITHLHGAHVQPDSDGYPEAWYLPDANDIPMGFGERGSLYDQIPGAADVRGAALFQYPNDQRSTTLWYHDHALGMTRANVYAGLAGFYMVREPRDARARLPGPAPQQGVDPNNNPTARRLIREIPILIQDRSFNANGSLFYPGDRAFFEGLNQPPETPFLDIPFIPDLAQGGGRSDVSPIWNPEFFGNTVVVNGKTWPFLNVEKRRYRLRFLNGSDSRFLILQNDNGLPFWQIGADGGFLPAPVQLDRLLIAPAERADVIVDFSNVPVGTEITLLNLGPDEPFGGGEPSVDFDPADPATTGKVMKFVVGRRIGPDTSASPDRLSLPAFERLGPEEKVRKLSLNEDSSLTVCAETQDDGSVVEAACEPDLSNAFGPTSARLGGLDDGAPLPETWMDDITQLPGLDATEIWEIYNFTADAHPIHVHLVQFEVVNRQNLVTDEEGITVPPAVLDGDPQRPEPWETGTKDTVIVYPGQVARVKARFDIPGLFVWHCHILSHEDNEMMRPYFVGPKAPASQ